MSREDELADRLVAAVKQGLKGDHRDFDRLAGEYGNTPAILSLIAATACSGLFAAAGRKGGRMGPKVMDEIIKTIKVARDQALAQCAALESRIDALEARGPSMKYCGTWQDRAKGYSYGETATRQGALWHSNANGNRSIPGQGASLWTLCAKAGRDARDRRDDER
jgi:hypothetical protein